MLAKGNEPYYNLGKTETGGHFMTYTYELRKTRTETCAGIFYG